MQRRAVVLKSVVVGLCLAELGAIATGRYPTISALSHKYMVVEAALIAAFLVDVHYLQRQFVEAVQEVADSLEEHCLTS